MSRSFICDTEALSVTLRSGLEIGEPSVCGQGWRHGSGYYPGMLCCEKKLEAETFSSHGIG